MRINKLIYRRASLFQREMIRMGGLEGWVVRDWNDDASCKFQRYFASRGGMRRCRPTILYQSRINEYNPTVRKGSTGLLEEQQERELLLLLPFRSFQAFFDFRFDRFVNGGIALEHIFRRITALGELGAIIREP